MSVVLMFSTSSVTSAASASGAACCRFAIAVCSASSRLTPGGSTPAIAFSRCVPRRWPSAQASSSCAANSASRPGRHEQAALAGLPVARARDRTAPARVRGHCSSCSMRPTIERVDEQDLDPREPGRPPQPRSGRRRPARATAWTGSRRTAASLSHALRDVDAGGLFPQLDQRGHVLVAQAARPGFGEALLGQRAEQQRHAAGSWLRRGSGPGPSGSAPPAWPG